jgi:hypothetical protein
MVDMYALWRLRVAVYGGWLAGLVLICVELAAGPHARSFALVLIIESFWVAYLVLADAYLVVRRRGKIRPDYLAFIVAVSAMTCGFSEPARWASITGFALAVLAGAFAVSLFFQRAAWGAERVAAPPSPTASAQPILPPKVDEGS